MQELAGLAFAERPQFETVEEPGPSRRCEPRRHRRLATHQEHADIVLERGYEDLAQPGVEQAEDLVVVEGKDHPPTEPGQTNRGPGGRRQLAADGRAEVVKKSAGRRLDRSAV